ncbi:hypothetical protein NQ176_g2373 [Zarea fungicola]|uniref:Uncharacterized protein n=1 Tax=Zarea fungicola TaxID=93591 RepID=A0ACC1NNG4_9HYPO|nr:hypothetical protein NQ176_g2373 [Lecanicillium fungicola]
MALDDLFATGETFVGAVAQLFRGPESETEAIIKRLYTEDCDITVMGNKMTRDDLLAYIKKVQGEYSTIDFRTERFVRNGNQFAEKHISIGQAKYGSVTEAEVWVMGELNAEGKAIVLQETMRLITGSVDNIEELKS